MWHRWVLYSISLRHLPKVIHDVYFSKKRVYVVLENKYLLKLFSLINPIVGQLTKKNQQEEEVLFGNSNDRRKTLSSADT